MLKVIVGGVICVAALTLFLAVHHHLAALQSIEMEKLRLENQRLRLAVQSIDDRTRTSSADIERLADSERMLRIWAGIPEVGADTRRLGVGGGEDSLPVWAGKVSAEVSDDLRSAFVHHDRLSRQARFLAESFDQIETTLTQNRTVRDHTPSILPIPADAAHWISSRYGYRHDPFNGRREFHNGIDIAGHRGTPILATANGVVEKIEKDRRIGFYIAIDHSHGMRTVYGHLQRRPNLQVGQRVSRGDFIGKMGNSGRSTGPHVHYAVFQNGRTRDPRSFIFNRDDQKIR